MGYDRNDCWMTCGERDDKCAEMGLMEGPFHKDPFAEIERLRAQQKDMQDRFQAALSWMADQDPQLVEAATEKFLNEQLTK